MKKLLELLGVFFLLQYSAVAAYWSCYFDTARVTVPTPTGQQVTMTLYNTSGVAVSTATGYFYWQGSQMVGYFSSSNGTAGTYVAGIIGTNGNEYRTNSFNLVDTGSGGLNGPGWIHGEAFPNLFTPVTVLNGNYAITGTLDIDGNKLTLGTQVITPTLPGFTWDYVPVAGSSTLGSLVSSTSHYAGSWSWATAGTTLMSLNSAGLTVNNSLVVTESTVANLHPSRFTVGSGTSATGVNALSVGSSTIAAGLNSVALGTSVTAESFSEVTIGRYNVLMPSESATTWVGTDNLFVIGNGSGPAQRSNALTVLKNGNAAFSASLSAGPGTISTGTGQVVLGQYNNLTPDNTTTPPSIRTNGVFIIGAGSSSQPANAMRVTTTGVILIPKQGDLQMGGFNTGEQP